MIKFNTVVIEGFGSIGNNFVFPLDLKGTHLIKGRNGAGKTSIFNAVAWCLYGANLKGITNGLVATWKRYQPSGYKGTRVALFFTVDGHNYCVVRHIKFKGTSYGVRGDNTLMVYKGAEMAEIDSDTATHENLVTTGLFKADQQGYINRLVGMDYKIFVNSILFGQNMTRLINASGAEKRKLFEDIFNTLWATQAKDKAKENLDVCNTSLSTLEGEIHAALRKYDLIHEQYEKSKVVVSEFDINKTKAVKRKAEHLQTLQTEKGELDIKLEKSLESIGEYITKQQAAELLVDEFDSTELVKVMRNLKNVKVTLRGAQTLQTEQQQLLQQHQTKISRFDNDLWHIEDSHKRENKKLNKQLAAEEKALDEVVTTCHACGKPVDASELETVKGNIAKKITDIKAEINKLAQDTSYNDKVAEKGKILGADTVIKERLSELDLEITGHKAEVEKLVAKEEEYSKGLVQLEKDLDKLNREVTFAKRTHKVSIEQAGKLDGYIEAAEKDLAEAKVMVAPVMDLGSMEDELAQLDKDIVSYRGDAEKLKTEQAAYTYWYKKGFASTGLSSYIFSVMLDELNRCTHKWAERVGLNIQMGIDLDKASKPFFTKVMLEDGTEVNHKELSGGEQQLINVCIAFGTHEMVSKTLPLLILDEVFENLDTENIAKVFDFVRLKVDEGKNVYIITHQDNLDFKYTKTLEIVKLNKLTQVLWQ